MSEIIQKPGKLEDEHLEYLDDLRESGVTNMFGASSYLEEDFPDLSKEDAKAILGYWMKTFTERHNNGKLFK